MTPSQLKIGDRVHALYGPESLAGTVDRVRDDGSLYVIFDAPHVDLGSSDLFDPADVTLLDEPGQGIPTGPAAAAVNSPVTFRDRAAVGLKYGIPVIPLRGKAPFLAGWQNAATTEPAQIEQWNTQFPDANCGMVARAEDGGFWCLEVDSPEVAKRYKQATGLDLPGDTLIVQSRLGRGHRWFRHTAESRAMGNLSQNDVRGKDFSVRAHNEQAVAPKSIHPDSRLEYRLIRDVEPREAPSELISWLISQKVSASQKEKSSASPSAIAEAPIPSGSRNSALTSLGGRLHHSGLSDALVLEALQEANTNRCTPPLLDGEVATIAASVCRYDTSKDVQAIVHIGGEGTTFAQISAISLSYSDEIFHGLAGRIIRKLQPETESHPVGNLLELLAAFGNIIGPNPFYMIEDKKHFTNLFVVKVGKSSKSRKGTGKARIERIVSGLDLCWFTSRNTSGMGSGEGVVWEVRDKVLGPVKDKHTGSIRFEVTDPGIDDKRLYISEGEFVGVLAVAGRKDSLLSKVIRDAWDHNPIRNKTKGQAVVCQDPHISISADITREELQIQLKESDKFNGFSNRFLWCFVERQGLKPHGGEEIDWSAEIAELYKAVEFGRNQKRIFMDRNARLMWERMYDELSEDIPGLIGAVTSRAEAQTIRLALIFAMLDLSDHISTEHLKAARALWQYLEDSARIIFGGVTKDHQRILDFLQRGPSSIPELRVELFSKNRKMAEVERDLRSLIALGKVASSTDDGVTERFRLAA